MNPRIASITAAQQGYFDNLNEMRKQLIQSRNKLDAVKDKKKIIQLTTYINLIDVDTLKNNSLINKTEHAKKIFSDLKKAGMNKSDDDVKKILTNTESTIVAYDRILASGVSDIDNEIKADNDNPSFYSANNLNDTLQAAQERAKLMVQNLEVRATLLTDKAARDANQVDLGAWQALASNLTIVKPPEFNHFETLLDKAVLQVKESKSVFATAMTTMVNAVKPIFAGIKKRDETKKRIDELKNKYNKLFDDINAPIAYRAVFNGVFQKIDDGLQDGKNPEKSVKAMEELYHDLQPYTKEKLVSSYTSEELKIAFRSTRIIHGSEMLQAAERALGDIKEPGNMIVPSQARIPYKETLAVIEKQSRALIGIHTTGNNVVDAVVGATEKMIKNLKERSERQDRRIDLSDPRIAQEPVALLPVLTSLENILKKMDDHVKSSATPEEKAQFNAKIKEEFLSLLETHSKNDALSDQIKKIISEAGRAPLEETEKQRKVDKQVEAMEAEISLLKPQLAELEEKYNQLLDSYGLEEKNSIRAKFKAQLDTCRNIINYKEQMIAEVLASKRTPYGYSQDISLDEARNMLRAMTAVHAKLEGMITEGPKEFNSLKAIEISKLVESEFAKQGLSYSQLAKELFGMSFESYLSAQVTQYQETFKWVSNLNFANIYNQPNDNQKPLQDTLHLQLSELKKLFVNVNGKIDLANDKEKMQGAIVHNANLYALLSKCQVTLGNNTKGYSSEQKLKDFENVISDWLKDNPNASNEVKVMIEKVQTTITDMKALAPPANTATNDALATSAAALNARGSSGMFGGALRSSPLSPAPKSNADTPQAKK